MATTYALELMAILLDTSDRLVLSETETRRFQDLLANMVRIPEKAPVFVQHMAKDIVEGIPENNDSSIREIVGLFSAIQPCEDVIDLSRAVTSAVCGTPYVVVVSAALDEVLQLRRAVPECFSKHANLTREQILRLRGIGTETLLQFEEGPIMQVELRLMEMIVDSLEDTEIPEELRGITAEFLLTVARRARAMPSKFEGLTYSALRRYTSLIPESEASSLVEFLSEDDSYPTIQVASQCIAEIYRRYGVSTSTPSAETLRDHLEAQWRRLFRPSRRSHTEYKVMIFHLYKALVALKHPKCAVWFLKDLDSLQSPNLSRRAREV